MRLLTQTPRSPQRAADDRGNAGGAVDKGSPAVSANAGGSLKVPPKKPRKTAINGQTEFGRCPYV
jgi:hypothetical protein